MADTGFWVPPDKRERFVLNTVSSSPGEFTPTPISVFSLAEPAPFASGGQGLASTADDYLAFARMLVRGGETGQGRLLQAETVRLMTTNRLTPAQRQGLLMGMPLFSTSGLGLGVSVIMDAHAHALRGAGEVGAFGWPGAFGGWWQGDPARDAVVIWLQDCTPPPPEGGLPRMPGMAAAMAFQKAAYQALA